MRESERGGRRRWWGPFFDLQGRCRPGDVEARGEQQSSLASTRDRRGEIRPNGTMAMAMALAIYQVSSVKD